MRNTNPGTGTRSAGFTLIEALVSLALLGAVLGLLASNFSEVTDYVMASEGSEESLQVLKSVREVLDGDLEQAVEGSVSTDLSPAGGRMVLCRIRPEAALGSQGLPPPSPAPTPSPSPPQPMWVTWTWDGTDLLTRSGAGIPTLTWQGVSRFLVRIRPAEGPRGAPTVVYELSVAGDGGLSVRGTLQAGLASPIPFPKGVPGP